MIRRPLRRFGLLPCLLLLLPTPIFTQKPTKKSMATGKVVRHLEAPIALDAVRYKPEGRPDPFLDSRLLRKDVEDPDEEVPRGQPPAGIAGMYIAQSKLLGVVRAEGPPTAVMEGTDHRAYFLLENDRLFDGYIKKIEADSVILIRETKLRSGKVVTQEVIKRLRTP